MTIKQTGTVLMKTAEVQTIVQHGRTGPGGDRLPDEWELFILLKVPDEHVARLAAVGKLVSEYASSQDHFRLVDHQTGRVVGQWHDGVRIPLPTADRAPLPQHTDDCATVDSGGNDDAS